MNFPQLLKHWALKADYLCSNPHACYLKAATFKKAYISKFKNIAKCALYTQHF